MRILSIDWDYFMNCSDEFRALNFPDGGNERIGSALSTWIWGSRYGFNPEIEKVKLLESDLDAVKKLLDYNKGCYYLITADSHKHLGEFILAPDMEKTFEKEDIYIANIDHHHDAYGIGDALNCGNWINKVVEKYPKTKIDWVGNCDSDKVELENVSRVSLDSLKEKDFDIVYLCRSGVWSPPHLDKQFGVLNRFANKRAAHTLFREEIPNRWDSDFQKDVAQNRKMREEARKALAQ